MKRTAHKLLGVILVLALCLGLFPGVLAAEDDKVSTVKVETAIEPIYDEVGSVGSASADEDAELYYAAVKVGDKWGYINVETGVMVIEPKYDYADSFANGVALAAKEAYGFDDASGKRHGSYQLYLLNSSGEEKALQRYDYNSYAGEYLYNEYTVMGYSYDEFGDIVDIDPIDSSWGCYGGVVHTDFPYLPDGTPIVPQNPDALYPGASITSLTMWGACVDGVIPMQAEYYWYDSEGGDYSNYDNGAVAFFMDLNGNITRTFPKASYLDNHDAGVYVAYAPDESGLAVVQYGKWVATGSYEEGNYERRFDIGTGAMYADGTWAVSPVYHNWRYYTSGLYFSQGLWTVSKDGEKWGAVNAKGVEAIPLQYDALTGFTDDLAAVEKDGKWYYIDMYDNAYQIGTPEGGVADKIMIASHFSDNIAAVYDGERAYCIVNTPVNGVLPAIQGTEELAMSVYFPNYEEYLETGVLGYITSIGKYVAIERDGKWGYLKLTFELEGINPFDDVHIGDYYYDSVQWAVENGITTGTDDDATFAPDLECTRAQIATFLYRAAGEPEVTSAAAFTDVPAGEYYADAVAWAVEKGITTGTDDAGTTFSPEQVCDRAQIVTFLYRAAGKPQVTSAAAFTDVPAGEYYADAVAWAVENGITTGTDDAGTIFDPTSTCTRGQGVTFLYRAQAEK